MQYQRRYHIQVAKYPRQGQSHTSSAHQTSIQYPVSRQVSSITYRVSGAWHPLNKAVSHCNHSSTVSLQYSIAALFPYGWCVPATGGGGSGLAVVGQHWRCRIGQASRLHLAEKSAHLEHFEIHGELRSYFNIHKLADCTKGIASGGLTVIYRKHKVLPLYSSFFPSFSFCPPP